MNAQLTELCESLRANAMRAQSLTWKSTADQLIARPKPDSWSAAECVVHLTLTTQMFMPRWSGAFAAARAAGLTGDGPFTMDLVGRMLDWALEPPVRFRIKAPPNLQPVAGSDFLKDFLDSQNQWLELITQCDGLALDRIKIASPVSDAVRYNVWASFAAAEAHQRRHLLQAERAIPQKD